MQSPDQRCSRRSFVTRSAVLLGSAALFPACDWDPLSPRAEPDPNEPPTDGLHLYIDESGTASGAGAFVVGALSARDPVKHERSLQQLRREHRYYTELRYRSTDRFRLPFARDLIGYVAAQPDLRFTARVVQGGAADQYVDLYAAILRDTVETGEDCVVHLERRSSDPQQTNLRQQLSNRLPNLRGVYVGDSATNELGQVADLITGSIYGEVTGVGDRTKMELIRRLRSELGVDRLLGVSLAGFRVSA